MYLGSFQLFRLKAPEEAELWPSMLSWKDSSWAPETLLSFTPVGIASGKSAHLVKAETIFLSLSFEVCTADIVVSGVVWSSQA